MQPRKKWDESPEGEKKILEKVLDSFPTKEEFAHRIRTAVSIAFTVFCFAVFGVLEWVIIEAVRKPDYSVIKAEFKRQGRAVDGQRISELATVCKNQADTQLACKALYASIIPDGAIVAISKP